MTKKDDKSAPKRPKLELDENGEMTQDYWNKLMNYYEDTNKYDRMQESLSPEIRKIDERAKELKIEADRDREERLKKLKKIKKDDS